MGCTPTLVNNTITRNRCTVTSSSAQGGGLLAYSGSSATGKNNVIYDNVSTTSPNVGGTVTFTYTCAQGGLPGTGNISSDPLLVNSPPTGYCYLSQTAAGQSLNSPCMNAGDPASPMITGSTRTDMVQDAGTVDMGYHWITTLSAAMPNLLPMMDENESPETGFQAQPQSMDLKVFNHPNPFNPTTTISLLLDQASPVNLTVFDASGRAVENLFQGNLDAGRHDFLFSGNALPTGVYMYRAEVAGRIATGKALLIK